LSISILRSRKFLQMLKMVAHSNASISSPQREIRIRASRIFKFNLSCEWFWIAFCLENPLSQIAILDKLSITFYQSWISLGRFVCHSKSLPHMHQVLNIVLFSCRTVFVNSKSSRLHMSLSSSVYWKFGNILSSHNLMFVIWTIIAWINMRATNFGCIEYRKVWEWSLKARTTLCT
jgi:hypothetical protein